MAKDKDRALNPAAAHRKQEKQKALKKGMLDGARLSDPPLVHPLEEFTESNFFGQVKQRSLPLVPPALQPAIPYALNAKSPTSRPSRSHPAHSMLGTRSSSTNLSEISLVSRRRGLRGQILFRKGVTAGIDMEEAAGYWASETAMAGRAGDTTNAAVRRRTRT